jgi:hypothetical protein
MRASSDSIGQLVSALAKAQIELVNPAKTLTAVIHSREAGLEGRSYRYAPLSAGLDIVRKTLGQHELSVIQTTHVDRETAIVLLTTTLAHGSGEWIAASWPVCRMADLINPRLMGAALTYARRYGLFTLVGLAGEDDLDAPPDLAARRAFETSTFSAAASSNEKTPDHQKHCFSSERSLRHGGGRGSPRRFRSVSVPSPRRPVPKGRTRRAARQATPLKPADARDCVHE